MPNQITDTAILKCDKGTTGSILTVTSQSFCFTDNKLLATEADKQAMGNIKPFGNCKLKPIIVGYLPCSPSPTAWTNTTAKDEICGNKILTEDSICICSTGGTISIENKGHSENHEIE